MSKVDVAVSLIVRGDTFLSIYNEKWKTFALPMTKRKDLETWDQAALRAAAESLGPIDRGCVRPRGLLDVEMTGLRDKAAKTYRYHVYSVEVSPKTEPVGNLEHRWLTQTGFFEHKPVSPTAREVVQALRRVATARNQSLIDFLLAADEWGRGEGHATSVQVAVPLIACKGDILAIYNKNWRAFTLPMTKRRAHETWDRAALRAAREWLPGISGDDLLRFMPFRIKTTSWRDHLYKTYDCFTFRVILAHKPERVEGAEWEWLPPGRLLAQQPVSPTTKELLEAIKQLAREKGQTLSGILAAGLRPTQ